MLTKLLEVLSQTRFSLGDEMSLHEEMVVALKNAWIYPSQEYVLSPKRRIDFFIDGIGIEVKVQGNAKAIYKQCEAYCEFDQIKQLVLVTNRTMGMPETINGKPIYMVKLGKSWL